MKLNLTLNLKPLSLNQCFISLRNGHRVRSIEYQSWVKELHAELLQHRADLFTFFSCYNNKQNEIHVEVVIENPDIYTKKGTLSRTAGDVDNIFKALGDNIFIFGVDDSQVTSLLTRKIYGQEWKINLILSLENRDNS